MIGCVGRGTSALLCPGAYYAVKTTLTSVTLEIFEKKPAFCKKS